MDDIEKLLKEAADLANNVAGSGSASTYEEQLADAIKALVASIRILNRHNK